MKITILIDTLRLCVKEGCVTSIHTTCHFCSVGPKIEYPPATLERELTRRVHTISCHTPSRGTLFTMQYTGQINFSLFEERALDCLKVGHITWWEHAIDGTQLLQVQLFGLILVVLECARG
jgi:hypothetical protein